MPYTLKKNRDSSPVRVRTPLTTKSDDETRRDYWAESLEQGYALLSEMAAYPVNESNEPFVSIREAAGAAGIEVEFSNTKLAGEFQRLFFIRRGLIDDLLVIAREMNDRGWIMKIEEGYRTARMQKALGTSPDVIERIIQICTRECGGQRPPAKLILRRAMCLVANVPANGTHLCSTAVDISVLRRDDGTEVCRGKPYLEMSEYTPMLSPFIAEDHHRNRLEITAMMERHGFVHYPAEFWHYNKGDALYHMLARSGQPAQYGPVHWNQASNTVVAYDDYTSCLTPPEEFERLIDEAFARLG